MKINVIAGKIVHTNSIICPSNKYRWVNLLKNKLVINWPTKIVIITNTNKAWSWKKFSCSINGDLLSCNKYNCQVAISKKSLNFIFGV